MTMKDSGLHQMDTPMLDNLPRGTIVIEDLEIGMTRHLQKRITDRDIELFAEVSTDRNPVHLDDAYAQDTIFEGRIATARECKTRLTAALGADAELTPELLAPAGNKSILLRMLSNLKSIYASRREFEAALACCDRCLLLVPDSPSELRDRGLIYHGLDCARPALMDLERYLELDPEGEGAAEIRKLVGQLHQQVPSIH